MRHLKSLTLAALLIAGPLASLTAAAQSAASDHPSYIFPSKPYALASDPWMGGLWIGTEIGVIFRDDSGTLTHLSPHRLPLPDYDILDLAPTPDRLWMSTGLGPAVYEKADGSVHPRSEERRVGKECRSRWS